MHCFYLIIYNLLKIWSIMMKCFISMLVMLTVLAVDPEAKAECSRTVDPATTPEQLLLDLEI